MLLGSFCFPWVSEVPSWVDGNPADVMCKGDDERFESVTVCSADTEVLVFVPENELTEAGEPSTDGITDEEDSDG